MARTKGIINQVTDAQMQIIWAIKYYGEPQGHTVAYLFKDTGPISRKKAIIKDREKSSVFIISYQELEEYLGTPKNISEISRNLSKLRELGILEVHRHRQPDNTVVTQIKFIQNDLATAIWKTYCLLQEYGHTYVLSGGVGK